jgi:hypothetical protein
MAVYPILGISYVHAAALVSGPPSELATLNQKQIPADGFGFYLLFPT